MFTMEEPNLDAHQYDFTEYVGHGNSITHIKLVRHAKEIDEDEGVFKPLMSHQVFGPSEQIFGYRKLKIELMYNAETFHCFLNVSFGGKIHDEIKNVAEVVVGENFLSKLVPWLPIDYYTDKKDFVKCLAEKNNPNPFGTEIANFSQDMGIRKDVNFAVHVCNSNEPGYKTFHKRMETLIVWFIDAASFIDINDSHWSFIILYEKVIRRKSTVYYPVGFCTLYQYYCYPDSYRYRISQFIIFPTHQNMGLGKKLLHIVNTHLRSNDKIYDVTVEDPSVKFQKLRDILDAKDCLKLKLFSAENVRKGFSREMVQGARKQFKMNEKQCRRIYEIIRLYYTNNEAYDTFLKLVRSRLSVPTRKYQSRRFKRIRMRLNVDETTQTEHRAKLIEKNLQNLVSNYRAVCYQL